MTDMSESSMDVDPLYFGIPDSTYDPQTLSSDGVQSIRPFSSPNLVRCVLERKPWNCFKTLVLTQTLRQNSSSEIELANTLQTNTGMSVFADPVLPPPMYGTPRYRWPEVDEREINDMFPEGCTPHFSQSSLEGLVFHANKGRLYPADQQLQSLAMMYGIPRIVSGLATTDVSSSLMHMSNVELRPTRLKVNKLLTTKCPYSPSLLAADAHNNALLNLAHWNIPQQPDGDPIGSDERLNPFIITPPLGLESSKTLARRILEGHIQSDSRVDSPGPFSGRADTFSASANHCVMQLEAMVISDEESDDDGEWVADDGEDSMDMTEPHTAADTGLPPSIKRKRPQRRDTGDSASGERPTKTMRRTTQVGVQRTRRHR